MRENEIVKSVRAVLERHPRINLHRSAIDIRLEDGSLVLDGEVRDIEEKRAAVESAKAVAGAPPVADYLHVRPSAPLGDGAIRDAVCRQLMEERAYLRTDISCAVAGDADAIVRRLDQPEGTIDATVADGIVTLRGTLISLSHRRLAAVLAWWAPGTRDVVNEIAINPPEHDNDGEIRDAIELVLDKDPMVHSDQVTSRVRDGHVVLRGLVATREEKRIVERDVWYIEGVRDVVNEIEVYQAPTGREPMPADPPELE